MSSKLAEVTSRNFSPTLAPELSDEARRAVNAAFDAMSTWRTETVDSFEEVIDKMAAAARKLDGRTKSSMPPVRKCKMSPKYRSKRWIV